MTSPTSTALAGRTALVTGGGRGIGAATAALLAAHGAAVAVNYQRNERAAASVVASITDAGGKAIAVGGDVTDPANVGRMLDETRSALGDPDILVLSAAGISSFVFGPLLDGDPTTIATGVAEQVRAVLVPVQAAAAGMAAKGGGSVVVVSAAGAGGAGGTGLGLISTAKAAANAVLRNLAAELGPRNIRVNAVAPGFVRTDASSSVPQGARDAIAAATPLGRTAEPADVAAAVLALTTADGYITGAIVPVTGGMDL